MFFKPLSSLDEMGIYQILFRFWDRVIDNFIRKKKLCESFPIARGKLFIGLANLENSLKSALKNRLIITTNKMYGTR